MLEPTINIHQPTRHGKRMKNGHANHANHLTKWTYIDLKQLKINQKMWVFAPFHRPQRMVFHCFPPMLRVATLQIKFDQKAGGNLVKTCWIFTLLKSTKQTWFVGCLVKFMHFDFWCWHFISLPLWWKFGEIPTGENLVKFQDLIPKSLKMGEYSKNGKKKIREIPVFRTQINIS